jgi:hypothetical protein
MATKKELEQADVIAAYYARRRRRKSLAGFVSLHRTHRLASAASITTGDIFPNTDTPFTFKTGLEFEAGTSEGLIFEFGSSTAGIAAWITNTELGFTAGNGVAGSVDSVTGVYTIPSSGVWQTGQKIRLTFAVSPSIGKIQVWMNGHEIIRARASSGALLNGEWSDSGDGSFMDAVQGTVNLNVPVAQRIAPSNFIFTELLSVYANQLPDHFDIFSSGAGSDLIHEDFNEAADPPSGWATTNDSHVVDKELISTCTAGSEDFITEELAGKSEFWASFDAVLVSGGTVDTSSKSNHFFNAAGASTDAFGFGLRDIGGDIEFVISHRDNVGNNTAASTFADVIPDKKYRVVIHWLKESAPAAGDAIFKVWIDKIVAVDLSPTNDAINDVTKYNFGCITTGAGSSYTTRIDNIKVGTTGTPPI